MDQEQESVGRIPWWRRSVATRTSKHAKGRTLSKDFKKTKRKKRKAKKLARRKSR